MDITVTSTGKTFRRIDSGIAALLLEAFPASFEAVAERIPPSKPNVPQWKVGVSGYNANAFCIELKFGAQTNNFHGKPDGAYPVFKSLGFEVPDEIVDQYRALVAGV